MDILEELALEAPKIDAHMKKIIPTRKESDDVCGPIWELLNRGGKRFRPVMCMLSCASVGGKANSALHTAAIIELFHNFTLIHDDIEDSSEMRRGKPCIHKIYGIPITINSGDGMLLYTLKALEKPDPKVRSVLFNSFLQVLDGQGMELKWNSEKKQDVREEDYLKMVSMKTGALISAACEAGALIGRGKPKQVSAIKNFGMAVGVAFQIQDDVLNLTGEEKLYKKEIGGDITEGKRTLMTIHALSHAQPYEREELKLILNSNTQDQQRIRYAIHILKSNGSISYAKEKARAIVKNAKKKLMVLEKNKSAEKLTRLADFLIEREL
ncbi:MAG: polyprenyl synthetase family protein [Candidatus Micrarchaeota archaeon]